MKRIFCAAFSIFWLSAALLFSQTLDRPEGTRMRVVSYNIFQSSVFPTDNGEPHPTSNNRVDNFARLVQSLDADIWALQEVMYSPEQEDVISQGGLVTHIEVLTGDTWYSSFSEPGQFLFSKFPIIKVDTIYHRVTGTFIDLPDVISEKDLYYLNLHLAPGNADQQLIQVRALLDHLIPILDGDNPSVPPDVMVIIGGDYNSRTDAPPYRMISSLDKNISGSGALPMRMFDPEPVQFGYDFRETIGRIDVSQDPPVMDGNIIDFIQFGPDEQPLEILNNFILNTVIMDPDLLAEHGINPEDVAINPNNALQGEVGLDHLPILMDLGSDEPMAAQRNPARDGSRVLVSGNSLLIGHIQSEYTLTVRSLSGKTVLVHHGTEAALAIPVGLQSGVYLVEVFFRDTVLSTKVLLP